MSEKKAKTKDSNELLNVLMIILGLLFLFKGVLDILTWVGIIVPSYLSDFATDPNLAAALSLFGGLGITSLLLGFWCLVAGIGMFREEEYAMGMALVVLSIMAAVGITAMVGWISTPFDFEYIPNYVTIVATAVGVLGFIWLLFTYKRYD